MKKPPQPNAFNAPVSMPSPAAVVGLHEYQPDTEITQLHQHRGQVEIAYCHQGQGVFLIDNALFAYGPGDVVIVPAGTPHGIQSIAGTHSDWYFNYCCAETVLTSRGQLPRAVHTATDHWWHFPRDTHPTISDTTRLLTGEVVNHLPTQPGHTSTAAQGFILALLSLVATAKAPHTQGEPTSYHWQRISPAIDYLSTHFTEPLEVEILAQACHFSAVHFRRLFYTLMGLSPRQYLFALRVEMAKAMLTASDQPILAIAHQVGFTSLSSFNRQFRAAAGMSPRAWRQHNAATASDDI